MAVFNGYTKPNALVAKVSLEDEIIREFKFEKRHPKKLSIVMCMISGEGAIDHVLLSSIGTTVSNRDEKRLERDVQGRDQPTWND